jgi:hypothetical protein
MARLRIAHTAYAAGLFDGEGSVQVYYGNNSPNGIGTKLVVAMMDPKPIYFLQGNFGGSVREQWQKGRPKPVYFWSVAGEESVNFAELILPYTISKYRQLELYLSLRKLVLVRGRRITDKSIIAKRHKLVMAIKERP